MWHAASITTFNDAELEQWLATCYVPSSVDSLFADPQRSVVAITQAGCGLSTALALISRTQNLLTFNYPPEQWPGEPGAFTSAPSHFAQWMAQIAYRLVEDLRKSDAKLARLKTVHVELLIWLVRSYLGHRQDKIWRQHLEAKLTSQVWQELHAKLERGELDDLFGATQLDITAQIGECLEVAQVLDLRGIFACIDISWGDLISRNGSERKRLVDNLERLLSTLTPLQHRGFGIKVGVPHQLLDRAAVDKLVRSRAVVTSMQWDERKLTDLAMRYGRLSGFGNEQLLGQIWQGLAPDVSSIWGHAGPAAALTVAQIVVEHNLITAPQTLNELRGALYRKAARLRLDGEVGTRQIWRGMLPIKLDETPFSFLERLWSRRGGFVGPDEPRRLADQPRQKYQQSPQGYRAPGC